MFFLRGSPRLFDDLRQRELEASLISYNSTISACAKSGDFRRGSSNRAGVVVGSGFAERSVMFSWSGFIWGIKIKYLFLGDHCFCWSSIGYSTIFAFPYLLRSIFIFGQGSLRQMQDDSGWKTLVFFEHLAGNLRTWIHLTQYKWEPWNANTVGYDSELFAFKIWCFMHGCMGIIFLSHTHISYIVHVRYRSQNTWFWKHVFLSTCPCNLENDASTWIYLIFAFSVVQSVQR